MRTSLNSFAYLVDYFVGVQWAYRECLTSKTCGIYPERLQIYLKNGISPMTENTSPTNWMGSGISLIGFFYGKPPANQLKMTWTFCGLSKIDYQIDHVAMGRYLKRSPGTVTKAPGPEFQRQGGNRMRNFHGARLCWICAT